MLNTRFFSQKSQRAFSLIEMLLVFLILSFLIGFSSKYFRKKETKVRAVFEDFSRLNQRLVSLSHLKSKQYRLVFELSVEEPDRYWVEKKKEDSKKSLLKARGDSLK